MSKKLTLTDFPIRSLGEISENYDSQRIPVKESGRKSGSYPYYGAQGIVDYVHDYIFDGEFVLVAEDGENLRSRKKQIAFLVNGKFWVNNHAHILKGNSFAKTRYLYYAINNCDISGYITGSTIPKLSQRGLNALLIPCPTINEQKSIASILSSLDDKIELNREMNETLEAMARAIFKDWFVDFGPTRAKQEGRSAYLPEHLWSLFPEAIDDETGLPIGWDEKSLDEIADFLNGLALQKYPPLEDEDPLPVIKIAELRSGITEKSGRASRQIPEKYIVRNGDFLFSWSGSLVAKFWTEGEGALNQHLFKVTSANYPTWFYTQWVYYHLEEFQRIAAAKATTMGHIQRGHLTAAKVICPQPSSMNPMSEFVTSLLEKTIQNNLESRTLAELRDRLLPKLMSGEIRIKDAEEAIGEVL